MIPPRFPVVSSPGEGFRCALDPSPHACSELPSAVSSGSSKSARCSSAEDHQAPPPPLCYRMIGSKITLAFMELEIRQFASAFSISSLALTASVLVSRMMVGFNVMVEN